MRRKLAVSAKAFALFLLLCCIAAVPAAAEEPTVSIMFVQDDLRDAVTELILQTGVNILLDDSVYGVVTLDLVDVPLEQALRMMALPGGYEVYKLDGFYFIGSANPESLSFRSFVKTETYHLKYVSPEQVMDVIPTVYQQYVRTGLYTNAVTITAPPSVTAQILAMLKEIDQPAPQVLIQAVVTEISQSELEEWGAGLLSYDSAGTEGSSWLDNITYESSVFNFGLFGKVLASLRALEAEQKAEIKANPRVIASSGQTVDLFSGETHFLALSSGTSERLEEINVGVSLNVTPRVVEGNLLRLTIAPEVSHLSGLLRDSNGLSVRRSTVSTDVYAESGQALLLAGMTLQNASSVDSHVPILGKLPLIRWFFTEKSDSDEERELLIFVTAEILPAEAGAAAQN